MRCFKTSKNKEQNDSFINKTKISENSIIIAFDLFDKILDEHYWVFMEQPKNKVITSK